MFRDPYSDRQDLYKYLSKNKYFIFLALLMVIFSVAELISFFRVPIGIRAQSGQTKVFNLFFGRGDTGEANEGVADGEDADGADGRYAAGSISGEWRLVLVNDANPLPDDFEIRLVTYRNLLQIDERVRDPLNRLLDASRAEGLSVVVASAYRSVERQRELYDDKVGRLISGGMKEEKALIEAAKEVARPGSSEHHLGLALDLVANSNQRLDKSQSETAENIWLRENCYDYGFILRYPPDKSFITGVVFEPWHFRYVGIEAAKAIKERDLCLEEYLDSLMRVRALG